MELVSLSVIATLVILLVVIGINYYYEKQVAKQLVKIITQMDDHIDNLATEYCKLANRIDAIAEHLGLNVNNSDNEMECICIPYETDNNPFREE